MPIAAQMRLSPPSRTRLPHLGFALDHADKDTRSAPENSSQGKKRCQSRLSDPSLKHRNIGTIEISLACKCLLR